MNVTQRYPVNMLGFAGWGLLTAAMLALFSGCNDAGFANADRVVSAHGGQLTIAERSGLNEKTHEVAEDAEVLLDGQPASLEALEKGDAVRLTTEERRGMKVVKKIDAKSKEKIDVNTPQVDPLLEPGITPQPPLADGTTQPEDAYSSDGNAKPENNTDAEDTPEVRPLDEPLDEPADEPADEPLDEPLDEATFSGKISSVGENQFMIKDENGIELTFMVNADTKYTVNSEAATLDQLVVDHAVSVTADLKDQQYWARMVDATADTDYPIDPEGGSPPALFNAEGNADAAVQTNATETPIEALNEATFTGKISSLGTDQFVIKDENDVELTFFVNASTKYTLDGNEAIFDQLLVDHAVSVTAEQDGKHYMARMVDATSGR